MSFSQKLIILILKGVHWGEAADSLINMGIIYLENNGHHEETLVAH